VSFFFPPAAGKLEILDT